MVRCDVGDAGLAALASSPHLQQLHRLDLGGTRVTAAGVLAALRSRALPQLTHMVATGPEAPELAPEIPEDRSSSGSFCVAHLECANAQSPAIVALAHTARLDGLYALALVGAQLDVPAATAIARSPHLDELAILDVSYSSLDDDALAALLADGALQELEHLDASGTALTGAALETLATAPQPTCLDSLDLSACAPTAAGL